MKNLIIRVLILAVVFASSSYGAIEEKVILCKEMEKKYDEKVYRKVTILFTDARLELQKRYKKFLTFEYQDKLIEDKDALKEELAKQNARYYASLSIEDKGNCKDKKCKVKYTIEVYDLKNNERKKITTNAIINNNEFTEIEVGHLNASAKRLVSFLKKK